MTSTHSERAADLSFCRKLLTQLEGLNTEAYRTGLAMKNAGFTQTDIGVTLGEYLYNPGGSGNEGAADELRDRLVTKLTDMDLEPDTSEFA